MIQAFDFDTPIDRRSLPGEKWGRYGDADVLPMWVADMDFAAPAPVIEALRARIEHGVFGYTDAWPSLIEATINAIERDHGWRIDADWLVWLPGIVTGFNLACRIAGHEGDEVFTSTPVYPPFLTAPANNGRSLVSRPLIEENGRWEWNRDATEATMTPRTRAFLLCNPHNPTGRVFDADELGWIAELAERNDLIICSDEIHCGLELDPDCRHVPIATLDESVARRTITLMAPSKTWNIPSLYCGFAIIPDAALRTRYRHAMRGLIPHPNLLGMVAAEAAYRHGDPWRRALVTYLRGNRDCVVEAIAQMPGVNMIAPQATYLAWIDCRATGLSDPAGFFQAAGVGLSDGRAFGMPGFVRLNFGCTRATLDQALSRMRDALETCPQA
jgi:cystathionine beta-lyase